MKAVIVCGGSGGHIFPGIAVARELIRRFGEERILIVCSKRPLDVQILANSGCRFETLGIYPLKRTFNPFSIFVFFAGLFKSIYASLKLLIRFRPDCVVGFGGYVSGPVIFSAWLIGIPRLIHGQNLIAGLANRLESFFAHRITVSFEDTKKFFNKNKVTTIGNPVRPNFSSLDKKLSRRRLGLEDDRFTVFVCGGSQGAASLNNIASEAFCGMDGAQKNILQLVHISGDKDYHFIRERYAKNGIKSKVFSFLNDIDVAYNAADLVVSRAGATTIAEITYFGKPSILVPYPEKRVHQRENAYFLSDRDAALVVEERDLSCGRMKRLILEFSAHRERLARIADNSKRLANPDATRRLVEEILLLAKGN